MHFKNFYNYKIRSLTLKLSFAGDVKKRNEDRLGLKSQPQGRSINGRLQKNNVAF